MTRRLTVVAFLVIGFAVLAPLPASADDCSSPADCSNTAWTVGGGAAVAAGLIAAAAASGLLPSSPTSSGGGQLDPECQQQLSDQLDVINDEFRYISELRGALEGAQNMMEGLGAQLSDQIGYISTLGGDMNPQGPSVPFADMGAGLASAHGARFQAAEEAAKKAAERAMRARASAQSWSELSRAAAGAGRPVAGLATASPQEVRAIVESMEATAQRLAAEEARLAQAAQTAGQAASRATARAAGPVTRTSYLGAAGGFLSAAFNGVSMWMFSSGQAEQMARGKALAKREDLKAEIERWQKYSDKLEQRIGSRLDHLHSKITKYDSMTYGCGAEPIGASAHQIYAHAVANASPIASSAPLPPRLVEPRKRELEEAEKPADCRAYVSALGQYERMLKSVNDEIDMWLRRRVDLAASLEGLDEIIRVEAESRWWTNRIYYGMQGSAAAISAGGAVAGLVTVVNLPVALGLGCLSIALSVSSDYMYSTTWHQLFESRMRAERAFMASRSPYIESEIRRLENLLDDDLRSRQAELEQSYQECAGEPGVRPPTPVDFGPRMRNKGRIVPIHRIRTWQ